MFKYKSLIFTLAIFSHNAFSQSNHPIELDKINSACVKSLLAKNHIITEDDLDLVQPSCFNNSDGFLKHEKNYEINASIEKVWDSYLSISAADAWKNKRSKIEFMFSKKDKKCCYKNEKMEGIKVGQMMFIKLKIFAGLVKLPVAHQVLEVNTDGKFMKFCYVEFGKSKGTQLLNFSSTSEGKTLINHVTYYKSDSKFRDKKLYPHIHQKIISEFHKNMKKQIERNNVNLLAHL
jgi:hypothetical protein